MPDVIVVGGGDQKTITACEICPWFETDEDAAAVMITLLEMLRSAYESVLPYGTVADALDVMQEKFTRAK